MRACGRLAKTILRCSMSGRTRSAGYLVAPVTLPRASGLGMEAPIKLVTVYPRCGCGEHGVQNLTIAGAPTYVAADGDLRLFKRRVGAFVEQLGSRHQHTGYAEAALHRRMVDVRPLQGVQT